ncbi:unnamed protein product [Didymodactylos carnosus]|uniref:Uncharacterized protein n=1 Tax=Didymodactylos carnosus TaxID=1234261 RepID=A0A815FAX1_9BILA|nr:unnamed protein product [Didymodactylos carnosus]CAF4167215.1 unnamed protein product [Didymodactylos carnosus]
MSATVAHNPPAYGLQIPAAYSRLSVADKVILVTWATSGIDPATAKLLATHGTKVVLAGRRAENGDKLVKEITNNSGDTMFIKTDVSKKMK